MKKTITIVTHSGSFHPDDVFAVATILLWCEKRAISTEIIRSREQRVIDSGDFVVDVGAVYDEALNRFDHHQPGGAGTRQNAVPYAAFGLVWKKYGAEVSGSEALAQSVEDVLVAPIDYGDSFGLPLQPIISNVYPYTLDRIISIFGSTYIEKDYDNKAIFLDLVELAKKIIVREIAKASSIERARPAVERSYTDALDKRLIELDDEYPWQSVVLKFPEPLFVVFPDGKSGNWGISAVRAGLYDFKNRKDFPRSWAGKRDRELAEISGVPDAVFCHNRLFFAVAKSREGAIELAKRAIQDSGM